MSETTAQSTFTVQDRLDMEKLTLAAMPASEESFLAAELVWGRGLVELDSKADLVKFIGCYHKHTAGAYCDHWLTAYEYWLKARARRESMQEVAQIAYDKWMEM